MRNVFNHQRTLSHYGPTFSLVEALDLNTSLAFTEAVKGINSIAHIAADLVWDIDPRKTIVPAVKGVIGLLEAAAKEQSVQSFVYTSSQAACITLEPGKEYHITKDPWNEPSKATWDLPLEGVIPRMLLNHMWLN